MDVETISRGSESKSDGTTALSKVEWLSCLDDIQAQQSLPISLVGVEIDENSQVLDNLEIVPPFVAEGNDIAILMGNEGQGIHPKHLEACQGRLIRILVLQYGVGTASFNVNVACSIVLYHIHEWKYRRALLLMKNDHMDELPSQTSGASRKSSRVVAKMQIDNSVSGNEEERLTV